MTVVTAAQGVRTQLLAKVQSAIGAVPTGNFDLVRYNTHSLNTTKNIARSDEIRTDRNVQDERHSNRMGGGDITFEVIHGEHDWIFESALFSTFSANTLKIGVVPQYYTIEDGALDLAQYRVLADALCGRLSLSFRTGTDAILKGTASFLGTDMSGWTGSSIGGTPAANLAKRPFATFNGGFWFDEDFSGSEVAVVTSMDLVIDNQVNVLYALGQQTGIGLEYDRCLVSGQFTTVFATVSAANLFINETETPLAIRLTDPDANTMGFSMGRVKLNSADNPVANPKSRIQTFNFTAIRDESQASSLTITKSA